MFLQLYLNFQIKLSEFDVNGICMPCRTKLKTFYEYFVFVIENQEIFEKTLKKEKIIVDSNVEFIKVEVDAIEILPKIEQHQQKISTEEIEDKDEKKRSLYEESDDEEQKPPKKNKKRIDDPDFEITKEDEKMVKKDHIIPKNSVKRTNFHRGLNPKGKKRKPRDRATDETKERRRIFNEVVLQSGLFNFNCQWCKDVKKEFNTYEELQRHAKFHKKKPEWTCCDVTLSTPKNILEHIKLHENPELARERATKWKCKDCDYIGSDGRNLRSHWSKVHRNCELCGLHEIKKETYFSHMQRHLLSKVPGKMAKYQCDLCKKTIIHRNGLKKHMQNFHMALVPKFVCDVCGHNTSVSQSALNYHIKNMHTEEGNTKKPCPICGFLIKDHNNRGMEYHIRNHHTAPRVTCTICGESIKHELALRRHIARRHGEKRHVCQFCEKAFPDKRRLRDHEAVHTGTPQYFCEFCGAQFKSAGNYCAHKRRLHPVEYEQQKIQRESKKYQAP